MRREAAVLAAAVAVVVETGGRPHRLRLRRSLPLLQEMTAEPGTLLGNVAGRGSTGQNMDKKIQKSETCTIQIRPCLVDPIFN